MKKFLLSIFCLFCIMSYATADEAKFDFTNPSGLTPSITDDMFTDAGSGAFECAVSETTFTNNGVTLNTTDGSTASRIWKAASGKYDLRLYKTATMTITAPNGGTITSIAFTGGTVNEFSADKGEVNDKNWTGSASKVVFTWSGNAKTQKINDITITFSTDGGTVTPDPEEPEGGEESDEEEDVELSTIAEVLAAGVGEAATSGTVVATYARGFLMGDNTGYILVYLGSDKGYAVGDAVTVEGTTTIYGGLLQFGNTATVTKTGTADFTHPAVTVMDGGAMDEYLGEPEIQYIEYTGKLTISGSYYNVAVEGASKAIGSIQYPKDGVVTATSGAVVKVTGYAIGVSSNKYVNTMAVKVEVVDGGEEPEEPETPTEVKECTVTEALAAYVDGQQIPAIVTGYIVGAMNSTGYVPEFGTTTVNTNILLSDNADETDIANCIIVQLPKGNIRNELNLVDHADYYKKQVKITGSIEKYFQQAGLKNPTAYEFTGTTGIAEVKGQNGEAIESIYDLQGRKLEKVTNGGIYIINGKKVLVK